MKSTLTAADVCLILKSCREAQVREIRFAGLHVHFGLPVEDCPKDAVTAPTSPPEAVLSEQIAQDTFERDEVRVKEQSVDELAFTNPTEYEELRALGELVDDDDADEE